MVFELLGVGEDFVLRWRLVSGCSFGFGVVIFLFVVCYGVFVEIEVFWGWSGGVLFFGVVKVMFWGVLVFGWRCYSFEGVMM